MAVIQKLAFFVILLVGTVRMEAQNISDPLDEILSSKDTLIEKVINDAGNYDVQILYTQINRQEDGSIVFKSFSHNLDANRYFYPASTVKLPVALLALENYVGRSLGHTAVINLDTSYRFVGDSLQHTLREEVTAIFAISDNNAYNRLFELVGRDSINVWLKIKKLEPVQVVHRFNGMNSAAAKTKGSWFYPTLIDSIKINGYTSLPIKNLQLKEIRKGNGFMRNDSLIAEPFDFSAKNYFPLRTQQEVLKRLFFPENYPVDQRFDLDRATLAFIKEKMSDPPVKMVMMPTNIMTAFANFLFLATAKNKFQST